MLVLLSQNAQSEEKVILSRCTIITPLFIAISLYGTVTIVYIPCAVIMFWLPVIFEGFVY